jgi:hypothetical protein
MHSPAHRERVSRELLDIDAKQNAGEKRPIQTVKPRSSFG